MLTIRQVEAAKPRDKAYKVADANGLYLLVSPSGGKYWRHNYKSDGKQKTLSLGVFPAVGLADARRLLAAFKDGVGEYVDKSPLFKKVVSDWLVARVNHLSAKYAAQVTRRVFDDVVGTDAAPILGHRPIGSIKRRELVDVLERMVARGVVDSAHRMAETIERIFNYAIDAGHIESHNAGGLGRALPVAPPVRHQPAVAQADVPALVRDIDGYNVNPVVRLALFLVMATFVRTSELRLAKWDEFDFEARLWTIPKVRMKGTVERKRAHVVPLSDFALAVLGALKELNGDVSFVFASKFRRDKPINANALLDALKHMGYGGVMTGHGFRSVASTWLNEQGFNGDAVEAQLSHRLDDKVRAAYNHAQYLAGRVDFMQVWGAHIHELLGVHVPLYQASTTDLSQ